MTMKVRILSAADVVKALPMGEGRSVVDATASMGFADPDGITIQLQDVRYCGGAGRAGEVCLPS